MQSFEEKLENDKRKPTGNKEFNLVELVEEFDRYYKGLDANSRRADIRKTVTMFANYENKFYGYVSQDGLWQDYIPQENDYTFSIPLFKAHVDTGITFYSKAKPQYVAKPLKQDYQVMQLAKMCQELGNSELKRMMTKQLIQREAMFMFLAGESYRQVVNTVDLDSPLVDVEEKVEDTQPVSAVVCADCGGASEVDYDVPVEMCPNPECMSDNIEVTDSEIPVVRTKKSQRKLPRPKIRIPNPLLVQREYTAIGDDHSFIIKRQKIRKKVAEHLYGIKEDSVDTVRDSSSETVDRESHNPISKDRVLNSGVDGGALGEYMSSNSGDKITEVEMWLDPSEYDSYFKERNKDYKEEYPDGMYVHAVGNTVVHTAPVKRKREWIPLTAGLRPMSSKGTGMYHLATLNDLINNGINLEYAILHSVGFPTTLIRSRYLSKATQALDVVLVNNIPDEMGLDKIIHRVQPANASGMLGVLSQRFEGYMQYVAGTWSPVGGASDLREVMGTATGASAVQEMMADRLGLAVQMRVDADIETIYSALEYIQMDTSEENREMLAEQYGDSVVEAFFESDLRSVLHYEPAKGTDEPQMESVTAFKAQTYGSLVASMTGVREFDKSFFYDFVAMMGDAFNLPTHIGAGRKEREVAKNMIAEAKMLAKAKSKANQDSVTSGEVQDPYQSGIEIFQQVVQSDMELMELLPSIQQELYDWEALKETFSDWLQSNEGRTVAPELRFAVALMFDQTVNVLNEKEMLKMEQQAQMASLMASAQGEGGNPPQAEVEEDDEAIADANSEVPEGVKRDGSTGAGRPRDVATPDDPEVSDTEGQTASIAFDQGQMQDEGVANVIGGNTDG